MPYRRDQDAVENREKFRLLMRQLGTFKEEFSEGKSFPQEVLQTDGNTYLVMRYLPIGLMNAITKLAGDYSVKITVEFLVEFLNLTGENQIFKYSSSIKISSDILQFFNSIRIPDKMQNDFTSLLNDANSKHESAKNRYFEIRTLSSAEDLTLKNLNSEKEKLSAELVSIRNSWTELKLKLEALRSFISSSEKMREVFGDAFVLPMMNPSLPTISYLESEEFSLQNRAKNLQDQLLNLDIEIMQSKRSLRTLEFDLMNAETAEEQASRECKKIQLNIQRAKLGLPLRN